ncbi:hypothetical protein [Desulfoluna sp.]|uniref:hypothetical protein n=1 Tax=Desulfoluna sp. TaxID=2045199 RepID=UPI002634EAED|nr:hypothetical protein [Desulfoluna sp.]
MEIPPEYKRVTQQKKKQSGDVNESGIIRHAWLSGAGVAGIEIFYRIVGRLQGEGRVMTSRLLFCEIFGIITEAIHFLFGPHLSYFLHFP